MIPLLAPQTVTLLRYGPPTVYQGRPVRAAPTTSTIAGSVQPVPDSARQWLPSGASTENTIMVYTYQEVVTSEDGGNYADRIEFDGIEYDVVKVKVFPAFLGQPRHWELYAVRVSGIQPQYGNPPPPPTP